MDGVDRQLAAAVLENGDEAAFRSLYRRHTPRLLGFVHRLLGDSDTAAEDLVQETWIRACEGLARFRWDSAFSTWLMGIGLNTVRERQGKDKKSVTVQLEKLPDPAVAPKAHETGLDLERSISLLPDGYRMVLLLHDIEGMKHCEIAQRLGISTGTSKSQLFNARRMLRSMLRAPTGISHA